MGSVVFLDPRLFLRGVGDKWLCNETSLFKEWHEPSPFNVESYSHVKSYAPRL